MPLACGSNALTGSSGAVYYVRQGQRPACWRLILLLMVSSPSAQTMTFESVIQNPDAYGGAVLALHTPMQLLFQLLITLLPLSPSPKLMALLSAI